MHFTCFALCCALLGTAAPSPSPSAALTLYVSPQGNDAWSGRLSAPNADASDGPFATLAAARDALRRLKQGGELPGPGTVLIRGGEYALAAPLVFSPEDSGTPDAPITYAAYPHERPVFSGGRHLKGWREENGRWVLDLPTDLRGKDAFRSLWVNGERRTPARTPNEGFLRADGTLPNPDDPAKSSPRHIHFAAQDAEIWKRAADNGAGVVVTHAWDVSLHHVASVDLEKRTATLAENAAWAFGYWTKEVNYVINNTLDALDAPGEWYADGKAGKLYYIPLHGERPDRVDVVVPVLSQLLLLQGKGPDQTVAHLRLEGLAFEYADVTLPSNGYPGVQSAFGLNAAVHATWARYCAFTDCKIAHTSNHGLWLSDGCQRNRVFRSEIFDVGAGGALIGNASASGSPDQIAAWNELDDNWIHSGGRFLPSGCGVWIGSSPYNTVSHNDIFDFYYTGVSVGWSWGYGPSAAHHNTIAFNHIHHIGQYILSDMGGIYTLGVSPGTILRNNWIHDVRSMNYGGWGIYFDEGSTDILAENNLVYDTKSAGFHQHYGKENRVRNNIFAFADEAQIMRTRTEGHISFFFEKNIVLYRSKPLLIKQNWGEGGQHRFEDNCYWNLGPEPVNFLGKSLIEWRKGGQDLRSIDADPKFIDADRRDFRLKPDSPALALGFQPFDATQAGLYGPSWWTKPAKRAAEKVEKADRRKKAGNPPEERLP